jgi:hypothetical protein
LGRKPTNPEATCNTQHTPHTALNRQAFGMVWVLCSVGYVVTLCCLLQCFRPTAQQPGGDTHTTRNTHHIQHRSARRFVWFGCCVMLLVWLPWVGGCLRGLEADSPATQRQHATHTTYNHSNTELSKQKVSNPKPLPHAEPLLRRGWSISSSLVPRSNISTSPWSTRRNGVDTRPCRMPRAGHRVPGAAQFCIHSITNWALACVFLISTSLWLPR